MANIAPKTSSNIFFRARCEAATHNDQLSSREGAADIMSIDRGRLYRIESSIANPYPEEIHMMADLYHAPELINIYCRCICPLGGDIPEVSLDDLDRISIKALSSFRKITETKESLLDIVEDGIITDDEKPKLDVILKNLDELAAVSQNLKIWIAKNLGKG